MLCHRFIIYKLIINVWRAIYEGFNCRALISCFKCFWLLQSSLYEINSKTELETKWDLRDMRQMCSLNFKRSIVYIDDNGGNEIGFIQWALSSCMPLSSNSKATKRFSKICSNSIFLLYWNLPLKNFIYSVNIFNFLWLYIDLIFHLNKVLISFKSIAELLKMNVIY